MKIIYIVELDAYSDSGVLRKVVSQLSCWKKLENDCEMLLVSKPPSKKSLLVSYLESKSIYIFYSGLLAKLSSVFGGKYVYFNKILVSIKILLKVLRFKPDIIYYRFGIWFPGQLIRFLNVPLVVEINSDDIEESLLYSDITRFLHLRSRSMLLKRANGFCCVTRELRHKIPPKDGVSVAISNGIDLSAITAVKVENSIRTQIIFVGNSSCPWHGVEKIVYLASVLDDCDFHIVGPELNKFNKLSKNITFYGFLNNKCLAELYSKMNIAIGTLSLHKKNMKEASALKVREYVAYGLPVILGYIDSDLDGCDFILNVGNYERNIHDNLKKIKEFIRFWKDKEIKYDMKHIDMYNKESQRIDFFKEIIESRSLHT